MIRHRVDVRACQARRVSGPDRRLGEIGVETQFGDLLKGVDVPEASQCDQQDRFPARFVSHPACNFAPVNFGHCQVDHTRL
jgi:hypothetical protein